LAADLLGPNGYSKKCKKNLRLLSQNLFFDYIYGMENNNNTLVRHRMQQLQSHVREPQSELIPAVESLDSPCNRYLRNIGETGIDSITIWLRMEDTPYSPTNLPSCFRGSRLRGSITAATDFITEIRQSDFGFRCKFNISKLRQQGESIQSVFDVLQTKLLEKLGLDFDLNKATIKTVEIFKDMQHKYLYRNYYELLLHMHYDRKRPKRIHDSTLYWKSKFFQLKIYDKSTQLLEVRKRLNQQARVPDNLLRVEFTLMRKGSELSNLGIWSIRDLLTRWHDLDANLFAALLVRLQKIPVSNKSIRTSEPNLIAKTIFEIQRRTRVSLEAAYWFVCGHLGLKFSDFPFEKYVLTCSDLNPNTVRSSKRRHLNNVSLISSMLKQPDSVDHSLLRQEFQHHIWPTKGSGRDLGNPLDVAMELARLKN